MLPIDYPARRDKAAGMLCSRGCDAYLATRQAALHYFCGVFMPWRGAVLITARGRAKLFYWTGDASRVAAEGAEIEMEEYLGDDLYRKVKRELDAQGIAQGRLAADLGHGSNAQPEAGILTAAEYLEMTSLLPGATIEDGTSLLDEMMMIKEDAELERMRRAGSIADYAFSKALDEIGVGMTENHVAGLLEQSIRDRGSSWPWSVTAATEVGSGKRTAFAHGVTQIATDEKIENNEFLILDFHPSFDLYLCDFSVPVFLGEPNGEQRELIGCWEEAVSTVFHAIAPGVVIADAVRKGIDVYKKQGLYEYCLPRFGHGLGLTARTGPLLNAANRDIFRTGMTFAMGAHLYRPGVGGMRLEYPVAVGENCAEQLASTPMKVHILQTK